MVELGQSLNELGGNNMGRVSLALHGQVFLGICSTCKGSRVLEYVTKFTTLSFFANDYVAINMPK